DELNTNDPAIANAVNNNFYIDGNVGIVYAHSGFKFGFAFTELFSSNSFNHDEFSRFAFSNLKNRLYSMSYRFNVGIMENIAIEPYVLYRQSSDGLQDAWEAASLVYFKEKVWTGAGYNQNNGLALFVGMNLKDKFKFNYSYDFPPFKSGINATSAHELHLTLKFGKKKELPFAKKTTRPTGIRPANDVSETVVAQNDDAADDSINEDESTSIADNKSNPEQVKIDKNAIAKAEEPKPAGRPAKSFTIAKGHYVVVGVFSM